MIAQGMKCRLFLRIIPREKVFTRLLAVQYHFKVPRQGPLENLCVQRLMKFYIIQLGVGEVSNFFESLNVLFEQVLK